MARVRVEPSGIELEVPAGVTIMQAARDAGYYWPNQCDMQCRCSNCFFRVVDGAAALSPMGRGGEVRRCGSSAAAGRSSSRCGWAARRRCRATS